MKPRVFTNLVKTIFGNTQQSFPAISAGLREKFMI